MIKGSNEEITQQIQSIANNTQTSITEINEITKAALSQLSIKYQSKDIIGFTMGLVTGLFVVLMFMYPLIMDLLNLYRYAKARITHGKIPKATRKRVKKIKKTKHNKEKKKNNKNKKNKKFETNEKPQNFSHVQNKISIYQDIKSISEKSTFSTAFHVKKYQMPKIDI
jgi:hypothetical protein